MSDAYYGSVADRSGSDRTVGGQLRTRMFDKVSLVLKLSEQVRDSNVRLMVQAACLDMVTVLEEVIEQEDLDNQSITQAH